MNLETRPGEVRSSELVLLACKLLLLLGEPCLLSLARLVDANGCQEGLEVIVKILGVDAEIPVEEKEKLLLHKVDFGDGETKVLVPADSTVPSPVLVLGGRVVEVLCRKNESGEEDPVNGAAHTLGDRR